MAHSSHLVIQPERKGEWGGGGCTFDTGLSLVTVVPETHTKRQATQHDCLPVLLGDEGKGTETVYGEEKIF